MCPVFIGPPSMNVETALQTIELYVAGKANAEEALAAIKFLNEWFKIYRKECEA